MTSFGIIDVGTHTIHLLIGTLRPGRPFRIQYAEHAAARVGDGGLARNRLTPPAMRRAERVLARYAARLRRARVDRVAAVATSAVRDAANGRAFVQRIRRRMDLPLRIISGTEEARLIYRGVMQAGRCRGRTGIVTIGGGSAQVTCGEGSRPRYAASRPLGAMRLAQRYLRHDPPNPREIKALRAAARRALAPSANAVQQFRPRRWLGSSVMIAQVIVAASGRRASTVTRAGLHHLIERLARSTAAERRRWAGVDPGREGALLPTAIVLAEWLDLCRMPRVTYAPGSLREGLAAAASENLLQ